MSTLLLLATLCAVVGLIPLLSSAILNRDALSGHGRIAAFAAFAFLESAVFLYLVQPELNEPFWGAACLEVFLLWGQSVLLAPLLEVPRPIPIAAIPIGLVVILGSCFARSAEMLHADQYAALIGPVETRTWTQDIQPKHPGHIRLGTEHSAIALARLALSQAGSIGSQFEINERHTTLQKVGETFVYVVPLDHVGWGTYRHTRAVPGFIKVSGEDPYKPAEFVQLPPGQQLLYTPGSYFGQDLFRHIWMSGYASRGLLDYAPELDEQGKLFWIVPTFDYAVGGWDGPKITGVLQVDPVSGAITEHRLDAVPRWVDLVVPRHVVQRNIAWRGMYLGGYANSIATFGIGARKDLTEPDHTNLVFGADGRLVWVTGVTSTNSRDASLVGLYYTDSRSGKTVYYQAQGSTETNILASIDKHQDVVFRKLHGVAPQVYNIAGTMAALVPMLNGNDAFQGLGIINVTNTQLMAFGQNPQEAYERYLAALSVSGKQISPEQSSSEKAEEGEVDRFFAEIQNGATTFYLHLAGVPHLFFGTSQLSPKLRMTRVGDRVRVTYRAMGNEMEPLKGFDNLSLKLAATKIP